MKATRIALFVAAVPIAMTLIAFVGFWLGYGACACHDRLFDRSTYALLRESPPVLPDARVSQNGGVQRSAEERTHQKTALWAGGAALLAMTLVGVAVAAARMCRARHDAESGIPISSAELGDRVAGR